MSKYAEDQRTNKSTAGKLREAEAAYEAAKDDVARLQACLKDD